MKTKVFHVFINTLIISGVAIWCLYESIVTDSAVAHCNFERGLVERAITNKVDEVAREIIDSWGEIDISQDVATHKEQWMRNFIAYTNSFSTIIRDVAVYRERNNLKRKMLDGRLCDGNDSSVYQLMETNVVDVSKMMPVEYFVPADKNWGKIKVFLRRIRNGGGGIFMGYESHCMGFI